ncbi:MAG: DUF1573 domain-containing protein [Candidatus Tenebribacter davisii]|nr:DUF1573 domain-containing protein [Candidatus Tenebribacter davisii]
MIPTQGKLRKKIGVLRSSENSINFGDVVHKQILTHKIEVENAENTVITMSVAKCPKHLKLEFDPETLKLGERGEIIITFDSNFIHTYGSSKDTPQIYMQIGSIRNKKNIYVTANLVEDFSSLSIQELVNAPVIYFPMKFINLGEIDADEIKDVVLKFENHGKNDLIIRNIEIKNKVFTLVKYDRIVEPGGKGKLTISTNPESISKNLSAQVTVITNDPKNSKSILKIFGSKKMQNRSQDTSIEKKKAPQMRITNVNVNTANNLIKKYENSDDLVILDVRTPKEYENGCLEEALNFDFLDKNFYRTIQLLDRSRIYLVYCKSGIRSEEAIEIMSNLGFENIFHMSEGMDGWKNNRLKVSDPGN